MTDKDHIESAQINRISRAMDTGHGAPWAQQWIADEAAKADHQPPGNTAPRFIDLRNGGNPPRRDLLDASPPLIFAAFMACVVLFVAVDWICARYLW